ncbi:response regulator transcription factor [Serinicoccus kebangsaanensis]|uniref:response regulator transcription factor n=1 Tax=Serinicoccus kebangsaanensis TaxID=2602069 RepID=UPI00124C499E|nr:response regulator transcription factor [Serinicoccus kebangsaanensis]
MSSAAAPSTPTGATTSVSILLYSNDRSVRDAVRVGVGERPADDVVVERWMECATPEVTLLEAASGDYDLLVLDGESQPYGGMGVCRQLKNELFDCPPVLVLTGRPGDGWLAAWSQADAVLARPLDEARLTAAIADLARR